MRMFRVLPELVPIDEEEFYNIPHMSSNTYYIETGENDESVLMTKVNGQEVMIELALT